MSINQFPKKINLPLPADSVTGETFSYNKEGMVVRFPVFRKLFIPFTIILVAGLSFGIGRLSVVGKREPIKIEYDSQLITYPSSPETTERQGASVIKAVENVSPPSITESSVVVSKNGERYHFLYCSGAKQIKDVNKIYFPNPKAAEAAGYTLAANCKTR